MRRVGLLALALAVSVSPVLAEEELAVSAQVDRSEVRQGEKLIFEVTIAGPLRETPKIQMDPLKGFGLVSTGQSQRIRVQSGRTDQTLMLTYTLAALEAGTRTLGPVKVEYHGKSYETPPVDVTVLPGEAPPKAKKPAPSLPELEGEVIL